MVWRAQPEEVVVMLVLPPMVVLTVPEVTAVLTLLLVLIIQPFDLAVFQQGVPDQPALLLEHLRGKDISAGIRDLQRKREEARLAQEQARRTARAETCKRHCGNENLDVEQKNKKARKGGDTKGYKQHTCCKCAVAKGRTDYRYGAWRDRNKYAVSNATCLACENSG